MKNAAYFFILIMVITLQNCMIAIDTKHLIVDICTTEVAKRP